MNKAYKEYNAIEFIRNCVNNKINLLQLIKMNNITSFLTLFF